MAKSNVDSNTLTIFLILTIMTLGLFFLLKDTTKRPPSTQKVLEIPKKFEIFQEGFQSNDSCTFVMYYSPSCGHCIRAKPEFTKLGLTQHVSGKKVNIKFVNPKTHPNDVRGGPQIRGYPTIRLYGPGDAHIGDYNGPRTKDGFLKFLKANV